MQALALTLFSALDPFPESLMPSDAMPAAAARQSGGSSAEKVASL